MVEAPLTMACINPARDLGPRIAITILGWGAAAFPGVGRPWWVWTVGPYSAPWPVAPPGHSSSADS
jgi:glycerol uptake facilitator protein